MYNIKNVKTITNDFDPDDFRNLNKIDFGNRINIIYTGRFSKSSSELMAYTYNHLYKIAATGLRFFTVYGAMDKPDMVYCGFADKYFRGEPINIFNNGDFENDLYREFTYVDDIVEGINM